MDKINELIEKTTTQAKAKPKNPSMRIVDDAEIIEEVDQNELDRILDKIAKTGYDGLSADEKRVLFEMFFTTFIS